MAVTHVRAEDRQFARVNVVPGRIELSDLTIFAVSAVAALALILAGVARLRVTAPSDTGPAAATVNLNAIVDPTRLEQVLAPIAETPTDARLAARELMAFLQPGEARRALPNVGAIARARVAAGTIDAAPGAAGYRARLDADRERARAAGAPEPESVALLTSAELAALKPSFVVRDAGDFIRTLGLWALLYLAAFQAVVWFWRTRAIAGDRVLLGAAHLLTAVGFVAMVSRPDPLRDLLLFERFAQGVIAGLVLAAAASTIRIRTTLLQHLSYLPLAGAVLLSLALIIFGSGPAGSSAKVNLGPGQPIEGIRLLLALFLAAYFARRWELLRAVRTGPVGGLTLPDWLNLPRATYVVPVLIGVAAALTLFFLQKDLGPALMLAVVFLATYAVARGTAGMAVTGGALLVAGFYLGYRLHISATLAERVRMWQSPWDNLARGGDQVAQALWAMASGGLMGTGIGLGDTRYLPAGHTDLILAAVAEDLGAIGFLAVAVVYAAIVWRAFATARRSSTDYGFFLALVLALSLIVPAFLMAAGILGLVPLTGIVTPFLSYGGSAMVANFIALGLLTAVRADSRVGETAHSARTDGQPKASRHAASDMGSFDRPLRWLAGAMASGAAAILLTVGYVQVVRADELLVRPHLGVQGDGARRFQYNPRVLDAVRRLPRGTIYDRTGLPLATDDHQALAKLTQKYQRIGVPVETMCPDPAIRCYPLGGRAFHLLGDARTRVNWGAGNTSFVERDREATLRGFDDRETTVRVTDANGTPSWTVYRDYRDLVPLVRHRNQPAHADARAILDRPRELHLTIDARLQLDVAAILADHARRSRSPHAAAVVLDVATGEILASVSYPWPGDAAPVTGAPDGSPRADLLDRARYGLYPPGSVFKLITAAAALRHEPRAERLTFTCRRLSDGRAGTTDVKGGRPVRDDVLIRQPHGTLDLEHGLVVSCNAYFAQLAAHLGPDALRATARLADISLAPGEALRRINDTLPQIGYGQADVVATPMRMARVAAAIAGGGRLREPRLDRRSPGAPDEELMSASAARQLAGYMRQVVLDGTGRSLRGHSVPIAGKTGTAEVDGRKSHAWFVGFAPHGPAARRVAVAVIIEHAGYGATAAAPAAGEIVAAAKAAGLIR